MKLYLEGVRCEATARIGTFRYSLILGEEIGKLKRENEQ